MRIIFLGDVVGSIGIKSLAHFIPTLKLKYDYDFLITKGIGGNGGISLRSRQAMLDAISYELAGVPAAKRAEKALLNEQKRYKSKAV